MQVEVVRYVGVIRMSKTVQLKVEFHGFLLVVGRESTVEMKFK